MFKKIGTSALILIIILVAAVFFFRYQIMQYSAERIIRSSLPPYIKIDVIKFDFRNSKVILRGFRLSNPAEFSYADLLEIEEITARYRMKGKNIIDGLEVLEPVFKKPLVTIERLGNGKLNITEMQPVIEKGQGSPNQAPRSGSGQAGVPPGLSARRAGGKGQDIGNQKKSANKSSTIIGNKKISDLIKLPRDFSLKDGKLIFIDRFRLSRPNTITFENVLAKLSVNLDDSYSRVLGLASTGEGNVNGSRAEVVKWVVSYNPTTPRLTMSNRFEVSDLDLVAFRPYYDKYSPLVFMKGKFSGTLVFDFDNGNIGSTNEIHLSDFRFYVKEGYENAAFWETSVPDLVKYFTTPYGEIVFDFKIKGDMQDPKFYLGPISKRAITAMAVDKIQDVISQVSKAQGGGTSGSSGSDIDKAKEYIDLIKNFIKK